METADQTNLVRGATGCGSVVQLLRIKGKAKGGLEAGTDVLNVACKVEVLSTTYNFLIHDHTQGKDTGVVDLGLECSVGIEVTICKLEICT